MAWDDGKSVWDDWRHGIAVFKQRAITGTKFICLLETIVTRSYYVLDPSQTIFEYAVELKSMIQIT
jgi:hypothetical protein